MPSDIYEWGYIIHSFSNRDKGFSTRKKRLKKYVWVKVFFFFLYSENENVIKSFNVLVYTVYTHCCSWIEFLHIILMGLLRE